MPTATQQGKSKTMAAAASAGTSCANTVEEKENNAINKGMAVSIGAGAIGIAVGGPIGGLVGAAVGAAVSTVIHVVKK